MNYDYDFNDGSLAPINVCEPHMPILFLVDISGSMAGLAIQNVERSINRFKADICKDEKLASVIEICIVTFNGEFQVVQNWRPLSQMKYVSFQAGGKTHMSVALEKSIEMLKKRGHVYNNEGIDVRMPYLVMFTDGKGDNIDAMAHLIKERTNDGKMQFWFMGVPGFDRETCAKLTGGKRALELKDEKGYDFSGFINLMEVAVKKVSTSAPGEKVYISPEENPLTKQDCSVKPADVNDWLN